MLKLPSELAVSRIEELQQQIAQELHEERDIHIDIVDLVRVDTACIQLLCALQKQLHAIEHKIVWHGKSEALLEAVHVLGLSDFLALHDNI
ncbi:lipid asymmetry maintenance protein MlaB [Pseudoalteromonas fenneropenaei]|uniref:Lipid asymmetry maintenance protein MlaB n=1 Tax=Pseudoalteromonas fenneropenaei TaxID=1737459 RepID=A0ABV7CQR7_9GAMM